MLIILSFSLELLVLERCAMLALYYAMLNDCVHSMTWHNLLTILHSY